MLLGENPPTNQVRLRATSLTTIFAHYFLLAYYSRVANVAGSSGYEYDGAGSSQAIHGYSGIAISGTSEGFGFVEIFPHR